MPTDARSGATGAQSRDAFSVPTSVGPVPQVRRPRLREREPPAEPPGPAPRDRTGAGRAALPVLLRGPPGRPGPVRALPGGPAARSPGNRPGLIPPAGLAGRG